MDIAVALMKLDTGQQPMFCCCTTNFFSWRGFCASSAQLGKSGDWLKVITAIRAPMTNATFPGRALIQSSGLLLWLLIGTKLS